MHIIIFWDATNYSLVDVNLLTILHNVTSLMAKSLISTDILMKAACSSKTLVRLSGYTDSTMSQKAPVDLRTSSPSHTTDYVTCDHKIPEHVCHSINSSFHYIAVVYHKK
jgi:hypothetical protein